MISAAVARIEYFFSGFVFSFLKDFITFADVFRIKGKTSAEVAQLVEHQLPKLRVAGSSPVFRSYENQVVIARLWNVFRSVEQPKTIRNIQT